MPVCKHSSSVRGASLAELHTHRCIPLAVLARPRRLVLELEGVRRRHVAPLEALGALNPRGAEAREAIASINVSTKMLVKVSRSAGGSCVYRRAHKKAHEI